MADARSGQITIGASAVAGPMAPLGGVFVLKPHPSNVGTVYFGDNGTLALPNTGVRMSNKLSKEHTITTYRSLNEINFHGDNAGDKVCWLQAEL